MTLCAAEAAKVRIKQEGGEEENDRKEIEIRLRAEDRGGVATS